ncbi:MAG TPA: efflux RND transporter periplasmic adaptor subunit [Vineibacter sp.]|nr:efflux RND transporter periplasmic adaptor subunit [Vineibacter sp.]
MRTPWLVGIAALAVLGGVGVLMAQRQPGATTARTPTTAERPLELVGLELHTVAPRVLKEKVRFTGSTQPVDQTVVKARVGGRLAEVLVREGDRVTPGQVLARFEAIELQARLNEKLSSLEAARADSRWAEKDRADKAELHERKVVSRSAFDQASAVADAKKSLVAVAEAQVEVARKNLNDAVVVAPFAGIVGERFANPGESIPVDGKLMTLLDTSRVEVAAQVPAADVVPLRIGQPALVVVEGFGERLFAARITRISPTTQAGSRSVPVFVEITDRDEALRGGLFGSGEVTVAEARDVIAIPATGLRRDAEGDHVLAIRDGRLARQAVTPGRRWSRGDFVEVAGIAAGERIIAAPLPGLKPGQAVKVAP